MTMDGKRGPSAGRGAVRPCGRLVPPGGRPVPGRACGGAAVMIRPNVMRKWKTEGLDREQGRDPVTARCREDIEEVSCRGPEPPRFAVENHLIREFLGLGFAQQG